MEGEFNAKNVENLIDEAKGFLIEINKEESFN